MPRDGSGVYTPPASTVAPAVTGTLISSTDFNAQTTDMSNALTQSIAANGVTPITANIPMSSFKFTGLGAGSANGDSVRYEQLFAATGGSITEVSNFRITLQTGVAVPQFVINSTTVYCTPYKGNKISIWNGTGWKQYFSAEFSLALDSNAAHTGYQQSGKNFDFFVEASTGVPRLCTSPAWTSDILRSNAIAQLNGIWTNNASIVLRFGVNSGDTVTIPANQALYLGTMRAVGDGLATDLNTLRYIWNMYNRVPRGMRVFEATDSWNYTTATWRQMNNAPTNQLAFVRGLDEDTAWAKTKCIASNSTAGVAQGARTGVGLDSLTAFAGESMTGWFVPSVVNLASELNAEYEGYPGLGYHYLAALEYAVASGTNTFYGDAGTPLQVQSGIVGEVMA